MDEEIKVEALGSVMVCLLWQCILLNVTFIFIDHACLSARAFAHQVQTCTTHLARIATH
jgi:hypothetical protein